MSYGQIAYETHKAHAPNGAALPEWNALSADEQTAWVMAAAAIARIIIDSIVTPRK